MIGERFFVHDIIGAEGKEGQTRRPWQVRVVHRASEDPGDLAWAAPHVPLDGSFHPEEAGPGPVEDHYVRSGVSGNRRISGPIRHFAKAEE